MPCEICKHLINARTNSTGHLRDVRSLVKKGEFSCSFRCLRIEGLGLQPICEPAAGSYTEGERSTMTRNAIALALTSASLTVVLTAAPAANPVIDWNRTLLTIVRTPGAQPPT